VKVVTLITRMIVGGAQRIALETAADLTTRGHEAPIWCGPQTGAEGSLMEEARGRGITVRIFPDLVRQIDPVRDLAAWLALTRALREASPDWLHTHSSKAGILGREAARQARLPRVAHTVHGFGFTPRTASLVRSLYVRLERREARGRRAPRQSGHGHDELAAVRSAEPAIRMIFVSPSDLERALELRIIEPGQGLLIPPGIRLLPREADDGLARHAGQLRASLGWGPQHIVGGFLGRLSAQKAPEVLLRAATRLSSADGSDLRWLFVGDGPLAERLRRESNALAGQGSGGDRLIHWAGLQEDPAPYLAAMDFLCLPSLWEGLPLTLMEAMVMGLPVIASDLPGVRALTRLPGGPPPAGPPVILTRAGDDLELAERIRELVRELPRVREMALCNRPWAREAFGLPRMLKQIRAVYEGALS